MKTIALFVALSLIACNREKKPTPEEEAAEAKQNEKDLKRAKKFLKKVASLQDKVDSKAAPHKMESGVLEAAQSGYTNFDVLFVDELAEPNEFPKVRIVKDQEIAKCAKAVAEKRVYSTQCTVKYVVVLKPSTYELPKVSGSSYTPGRLEADAYVFDLTDGELIGGGYVSAKTPESLETKSSNAEYELREKLAASAFESLSDSLHVKMK